MKVYEPSESFIDLKQFKKIFGMYRDQAGNNPGDKFISLAYSFNVALNSYSAHDTRLPAPAPPAYLSNRRAFP